MKIPNICPRCKARGTLKVRNTICLESGVYVVLECRKCGYKMIIDVYRARSIRQYHKDMAKFNTWMEAISK